MSESNPSSRQTALLAAITLLGAALRLLHLGARSLWMDEAASVALARIPWRQFAQVWWLQEGNMTAYYLLLRPWLHLGQSEAWIRLLSVGFGVAAIPLLFLLARRPTNDTTALIAAALLAVNPAHVYYSQEARSYSMLICFVLLSWLFFLRALSAESSGRDWALWIIFSVVAVYCHYFAALVIAAQIVWVVLLRPARTNWARLIGGCIAILVMISPCIAFVLLRGGKIPLPGIPPPGAREVVHLAMFLSGSGVKFALYLVLWTVALFVGMRRRGESAATQRWRLSLLVIWAVLPVAVAIAASLHRSVFAQRYLLVCLPATILLAAVGAEQLRAKHIGLGLVAILCVLSMVTDWRASIKPQQDWRGAVNTILASAQPGDAIVFYPFYSRVAYDYYRQQYGPRAPNMRVFAPPFYGTGEDAQSLRKVLANGEPDFQRVWVVLCGTDAKSSDFAERDPQTEAAVQSRFSHARDLQFKDIAVAEYGP